MNAVHLLSAILAIQVEALSLGAPVASMAQETQEALCQHMEELADSVAPPAPPAAPEPPEAAPMSDWDPEPHDAVLDASRCRALLLEIVRRAAYDWVLYSGTRRPERMFARDAHTWLFEEEPGHPAWEARQRAGEPLLSFLSICEVMDLDPEMVRNRIRGMTVQDIMTAGRPAERRRPRHQPEGVEDHATPIELDFVSLDDPGFDSSYEAHFAVACLSGN
jgi:hypothetical protein